MDKGYKIINLHAENIKRLKCVDITPADGQNVITVTGRNGQGKTSVLDSILWALSGGKSIQEEPIREGEDKALITLDIGAYKIKRTFTEKGTYISVENSEGAKFSSPQDMLDKLMGQITFDPLEFTRQKQDKQYETLRNIVSLDTDIDELDTLNKVDFDERTIIKRQAKELEAQAEGISYPDDTPDEPVDTKSVAEFIMSAKQADDNLRSLVAAKSLVENTVSEYEQQIETIKEKIIQLMSKSIKMSEDIEVMRKDIPSPQLVSEANETLDKSSSINQNVAKKKEKLEKIAAAKEKRSIEEYLDDNIAIRDKMKKDALSRAKMPIDGLSFENGKIFFNGIPFSQASNAEQIKVSTAIAMAMNPKLRVIRIKDGSLLDADSMETIRNMAADNDFQVWIERVSDNDPIAIVIEDGQVLKPETEEDVDAIVAEQRSNGHQP
jgi:DNA repair exonuclease SbcCD ATPase subunit